MVWGRHPDPFSHQPLGCAFRSISHLCAPFQDTQPAGGSEEWRPATYLDLIAEMIACHRGVSLIFADDVLWIFVVVVMVIDAASLPESDGASGHVAVRVGLPPLCSAE